MNWLDSTIGLLLTVLLYSVTNTAPSTQPIISEHWAAVQAAPRGKAKVLAAEMLGVGLRCVAIWCLAWLLKRYPDGNWVVAGLIFVFALLHALDIRVRHIGAARSMTSTRAWSFIVAAEVGLNIDNILASSVDVTMAALVWALLLFMAALLLFKGTHLGERLLAAFGQLMKRLDHPRTWWRRHGPLGKAGLGLLGGLACLLLIPLLPLAWRSLLGLWRLHDDTEELGTGVWVFILVLLGAVAVFDARGPMAWSEPLDRSIQAQMQQVLDLSLSLTNAHDILKYAVGTVAALASTFLYLPVLEARSRRNRARRAPAQAQPG